MSNADRYNELTDLQAKGLLTPSEEVELAQLEAQLSVEDMDYLIGSVC